jgi:hypothetical protein
LSEVTVGFIPRCACEGAIVSNDGVERAVVNAYFER